MSFKDTKMYKMLKVLWAYPIVVLMKGAWKFGKTDTSLLIAYVSKKWGLIDKVASNIWTFNNPDVEYVISLQKLRLWLHADKMTKLFLFDEGLKHVYRRQAMSKKNIAIITDILPEISKGHGRMIVISQIDKIDSDILDPVFCRAVWEKKSKKVMYCKSKHHPPRTFYNLPKSPIGFDEDRLAPFINREVSKKPQYGNMGRLYEIAKLRVNGWKVQDICDKFNINTEQYKRLINKALKRFIDDEQDRAKESEELGEIRESPIITQNL